MMEEGKSAEIELRVEDKAPERTLCGPPGGGSTPAAEWVGQLRVTRTGNWDGAPSTSGRLNGSGLPDPGGFVPPVLLTMHDVGLNSLTCFESFFNYAATTGECAELFCVPRHVHLDAPGHEENAPAMDSSVPWTTTADLAANVAQVVDKLHLEKLILLGVGAGGSTLLHYALRHPHNVLGLILVSTPVHSAGTLDHWYARGEISYLWHSGALPEASRNHLLSRWFAPDTLEHNLALRDKFLTALDRLQPGNVARYLYAYAWREDVSRKLVAGLAGKKTLLLSGKAGALHDEVAHSLTVYPHESTEFVAVERAGSLVLEERPDAVAQAVKLFLQGLGIVAVGRSV